MLGFKVTSLNGIIKAISRKRELEEVVEQLTRISSNTSIPRELVERARRASVRVQPDPSMEMVCLHLPAAPGRFSGVPRSRADGARTSMQAAAIRRISFVSHSAPSDVDAVSGSAFTRAARATPAGNGPVFDLLVPIAPGSSSATSGANEGAP